MATMDTPIQELIAGTAPETGISFFSAFIEHFAKAYDAQYAIANELICKDPITVRTLAFWQNGQIPENFEYQVKTTPCSKVYECGTAYYPDNIQQIFSDDPDLVDMGVNSYLGTQLTSHDGQIIGHICVLGSNAVGENENALEILKVFSARASAELERIKMERELLQHREHLKELVDEKTRELEHAKQQVEHVSQAKSEFLSRMSHELRTPLNAIIGFAEILQENINEQLSENQQMQLDTIKSSGWHLLELIEDVLDLSKLESGVQHETIKQDCDLNVIIETCVAQIKPQADEKNIEIIINHQATQDMFFACNENRLQQIIENLLSNAVKFNVVNGSIDIFTSCQDSKIKLSVRDTGPGINHGELDKVFDQFERLEADKQCIQGAGIGLAITKRLLEHFGGHIGIENNNGKGSTFWIEFPTH